MFTFSLIVLTTSERFPVVTMLPPTKKKSTQFSVARLIRLINRDGSSALSGSMRTATDFFLCLWRSCRVSRIVIFLSALQIFHQLFPGELHEDHGCLVEHLGANLRHQTWSSGRCHYFFLGPGNHTPIIVRLSFLLVFLLF